MDEEKVSRRRIGSVILAVVLVLIICAAAFMVFRRFTAQNEIPAPSEEPQITEQSAPEVTEAPKAVVPAIEEEEAAPFEAPVIPVQPAVEPEEVIVEAFPELDEDHNFYEKLAMGKNVSILVMGDGCSKGGGASEPEQSADGKNHTWYVQLADYLSKKYLNGQKPHVVCLADESATVIEDALKLKDSTDDTSYDLILLGYCINEDYAKSGMPFEALILSLHEKYPNASFITTLEPCLHLTTTPMEYMRGVSYDYGIPFVNLYGYIFDNSISKGIEEYKKHFDDHMFFPSDLGHDEWFELLKNEIDANTEAGTGLIKDRKAIDSQAPMFAKMEFIGVNDPRVKRVDDTTFTVDAMANGLAYMVHKEDLGGNDIKVVAESILYEIRKPNGILLSDGNYLSLIYGEFICKSSFTITFSNKEYANGLKGFYIYYQE